MLFSLNILFLFFVLASYVSFLSYCPFFHPSCFPSTDKEMERVEMNQKDEPTDLV